MNVCRLRDTPIVTFVNKLDRDIRDPIELVDEVEQVLGIAGAPINWPIGMGGNSAGCITSIAIRFSAITPGKAQC